MYSFDTLKSGALKTEFLCHLFQKLHLAWLHNAISKRNFKVKRPLLTVRHNEGLFEGEGLQLKRNLPVVVPLHNVANLVVQVR